MKITKSELREIIREEIQQIREFSGNEAGEIASLTGLRATAIVSFIKAHNLDVGKLLNHVKRGKLADRMDVATAISGKDGNKYQKMIISKFGLKENVTEARITHGSNEIHDLNSDTPQQFVKRYDKEDIFFTNDGQAVVTKRSSNIVYHGKDGGKSINMSNTKFVYCGIEKQFYSVEDYRKILKAVYIGKKAKVTPLRNITEVK